jgi:hypothetical protein
VAQPFGDYKNNVVYDVLDHIDVKMLRCPHSFFLRDLGGSDHAAAAECTSACTYLQI